MDFERAVDAAKPIIMEHALPLVIGTIVIALVMSFIKK